MYHTSLRSESFRLAAIRSMSAEIHQDRGETERLVSAAKDGRTDGGWDGRMDGRTDGRTEGGTKRATSTALLIIIQKI